MSIYGRVVAMSSTNFQNTHRTVGDSEVFDDVAELSKGQGSTLYISYAYCGTMKAEKHSFYYYAPWCPHCRHFAPEWERVAAFYASTDKVQVGAVDCTKFRVICNNENINGYPGVKIHHVPADSKKASTMPRATTSKTVIDWLEKHMKEHGVDSGVNIKVVEAQLKNLKMDIIDGDETGKPTFNDHSIAMKSKRLHDAGVAAVSIFHNDFFTGSDVLEGDKYEVALMWVEAISATFPVKQNRLVLSSLVSMMKTSNHWYYADWKVMLDTWKEEGRYKTIPMDLFFLSSDRTLLFCKTYTCSLWTLFHSMTVTDAAVNSTEAKTHLFMPSRVMAAIRLFVQNFFGCEECRENFLSSNPESLIAKLAVRDNEGPHAVIMRMWKMHNAINKAIDKKQWPSRIACPICYVKDGQSVSLEPERLHENEIVAYVVSAYGYDDEDIYAMGVAYNSTLATLWSSVDGFNAMMMITGFFVLLTVAYKTRRQRILDQNVYLTRDHMA
ncbi:protein disulfide-isomerase domain [Plasmopara halstedii]|uniref:Sulfhydryl oxidase n=1 Tax=Plasmopara halstedii TaxID=4781 RepID=A0A0P1B1H5_PLAHL|nr:protein disulfide-isomerase domain [Plasmopara halstedii]CEG48596.1 protein disulfide-isomerase domain [Plasmopara halstedii]|eukprot:XP_024584965.1 protein disulfide-isomerase domain [Plasmopara halstedii]